MRIEPFERAHLPWLLELVNVHLSAAVPGWAQTGEFLAEHLRRNPGEYVTDPWVVERATLCALEGHRVLAAVHLLRYGAGPEVNESYKGVGEIGWFLALPGRTEASAGLLAAAHNRLASWNVAREYGYGGGLPAGPPMLGVPDAWPHVVAALDAAGYQPPPRDHREALYGGTLDGVPAPAEPPVAGLAVRRMAGDEGARFSAILESQKLGHCECRLDLTRGGALPALRGWADFWEIQIEESWRNRGIGSWLLRHAAAWLKLAGCERIIINVAEEDDIAGAGRFYKRFGWEVFTRDISSS